MDVAGTTVFAELNEENKIIIDRGAVILLTGRTHTQVQVHLLYTFHMLCAKSFNVNWMEVPIVSRFYHKHKPNPS